MKQVLRSNFKILSIFVILMASFILVFSAPKVKKKKYSRKRKNYEYAERRSPFYIGGGFRALSITGNSLDNTLVDYSQVDYKSTEYNTTALGLHFGVGKYFNMYNPIDSLTIGLEPNLNVGLGNAHNIPYYLQIEVPIFLSFKYGAGASITNDSRHGIGLGIGYMYRYQKMDFNVSEFHQYLPQLMIEYRLRIKNNLMYIKGFTDLVDHQHTYHLYTGDVLGPKFRTYGLSVFWE